MAFGRQQADSGGIVDAVMFQRQDGRFADNKERLCCIGSSNGGRWRERWRRTCGTDTARAAWTWREQWWSEVVAGGAREGSTWVPWCGTEMCKGRYGERPEQ